jgi:hypothetical protein
VTQSRELIENAIYFFIATADAEGRPDCSYKGGAPGFYVAAMMRVSRRSLFRHLKAARDHDELVGG